MPSLSVVSIALVLAPQVFSHSFIIALDGANGVQSSGFGTRLTTRGQVHQYTGIITDKEINASTVGPCGRVFGGENFPPFVIDPNVELSRAEASGISTAHEDGSITMGVFVHNPDGAGPFKCDYSPDASLHTFEPMNITRQIEGVDGINPAASNYVYTLTAAFYPNVTCTGGKKRDTCIMRCRNQLGFGSCAALKLGAAGKRRKPSSTYNSLQGSGKIVSVQDPATDNTTKNTSENSRKFNTLKNDNTSNLTAGPKQTGIQDVRKNKNVIALGPDPAAFEIYKSEDKSNSQDATNVAGVVNGPPPHDPNYNPLIAPIPVTPSGVERRGLMSRTHNRFLHKRPRKDFKYHVV